VQPVHDPHGETGAAKTFAGEVWAMYRSWAERRGMEWRVLREDDGGAVAAVAGFGAGAILLAEAGLHVLEPEQQRARVVRVRVTAAAQPNEPAGADGELAMAQAALLAASTTAPAVVRRYRRGPSPEVRDRRRGWRTGKWDRVMAGDFDLFV
jgi:ATP-dependent Clp protease ATP-binding subunit ClpC